MRITKHNIKENLKVGDFVKVNDSQYSRVTFLYWENRNEDDLGFHVEHNICEGTHVVADHNVRGSKDYIEKFQS